MRRFLALLGFVLLAFPAGVPAAVAQDAAATFDVVVVGGTKAIDATVFERLEEITDGTVVRVSGGNRYATAARISEVTHDPGVDVAYVATGEDFPDALVAGPVAARDGGPVLLTGHDRVPDETRTELARLEPGRVVVLGGTAAVTGSVEAELATITGAPVERVAGETRFHTAAALSRSHFSPDVPLAYVATGNNFPDALTAGPAGAVAGAPILLADGAGLPEATRVELTRLRPRALAVLGGPAAVPADVVDELEAYTDGAVERISGSTREATATAVSKHAFPAGAGIVFLATGATFPDALAIGAAAGAAPHGRFTSGSPDSAGMTPGPVLLTRPGSLPAEVEAELERLGAASPATPAPLAKDQQVETGYRTPVAITLSGVGQATFTYQVTAPPQHGTLTGTAPNLTFTPDAGFHGTDTFEFTVRTGQATSAPGTVTVTVREPDPPVAHDRSVQTQYETPVGVTLRADNPSGDALTFAYGQPSDGTVTGTGPGVTYTPDAGFHGTDAFTFTAHDGHNQSNTATVTVTVLPPAPEAHDLADAETNQDTPVVITLPATNHSANPLTYAYGQPGDGTVTGDGPDVTYTPDAGFHGTDTFTFTAHDGHNQSNTATVTVTVHPAVPVAHDQDVETEQDTAVAITLDADGPSGGTLTYTVASPPADGTLTGTAPDLAYEPDAGFHGTDTFEFRVNDGFNDSNLATVTITVTPALPVAHDVTGVETDQDTPVDVTLDADSPSGGTLTYDYDQPANGTVTGTGPDVTYTPDPGFHGSDTFAYRVNDGFNDSDDATVTVSVLPAPPVAHDDPDVQTQFETPVDITLSADSPSGGTLTYGYDQPANGTVTGDGPGVTYTPDDGFDGTDTFTFTVDDGFNTSNTATVTVTVFPQPPEAHDVTDAETDQDTPVVITLAATNHSANALTYAYGQPADGTVTGTGPDVTYTPDPGFYGTDTFEFTVNDGFNDSNTATVTVTVNYTPPDHAFDAVGNTLLEAGVAASGDPAVRIADATLLDGVEPGFAVSAVDAASTEGGSVTWAADGTFTYAPPAGFTGDDTFTYTVSDGDVSGTGTVTVTVDEMVWYVDNAAAAGGDGRSHAPFDTLAAAGAASGAGDVLFVHAGGGAYTDGIALQADQQLLGEAAGLTVAGHDLVAAGDRPAIDAAAGDAIVFATDTTARGLDITGASGRGLAATGLSGTVTVENVDMSQTTGHAVEISGGATFTLTGVDITNSSGSGIAVGALSGTLTHTGTITQSGTDAAVSVDGLGVAGSASLGDVTSAASGITVANSAGSLTVASATLGTSSVRIDGSSAVAVTAPGNGLDVDIQSMTAYVTNAAGVRVDGSGATSDTFTIGGGSIDVTSGAALDANDVQLAVTLASASSSSSGGNGLRLAATTGTVTISGGAISGASGSAVDVNGGSVALNGAFTVTNTAGSSVSVQNLSGGSVALSGAISDTGSGIRLLTNSGSTIAFTGVLSITTSGADAFVATGGGTVTATAAGNSLSATAGRGLVVTNTTIGAGGLRFTSISASGAANGIALASTGAGALTVDGDGSANRNAAGGTISGMTGHAVSLTSTGAVTLRNMTLTGNAGNAVRAQTTGALTLAAASITANTTNTVELRNSVYVRDAASVALTDSVVADAEHNNLDIERTTGSGTVSLLRTTVRDNTVNNGLGVWARNAATLTVSVTDSTFTGTHATGVHAFAHDTAQMTLTVTGSTFTGNNIAVNAAAWETATLRSTISNNSVASHVSHLVNLTAHHSGTHDTVVTGNTLNAQSSVGVGLRVIAEDSSLLRADITSNTLTNVSGVEGMLVFAREGGGATPARLHAGVHDNTIQATGTITWGFNFLAWDGTTVCAAITGNTSNSGSSGEGLGLDNTASTFQIEGLAAGPASAAQADAYVTSANPGVDNVDAIGSYTGVAAGTCQQPPHAP